MDQFAARKRMRGQGGFTLIELLVVIAILAVLGGAVIIGVGSLRGNAQAEACKTDKNTIETAIQAYNVSNPSATLTNLSVLTTQTPPLIKKNLTVSDWEFKVSGTPAATDYETVVPTSGGKYKDVVSKCT